MESTSLSLDTAELRKKLLHVRQEKAYCDVTIQAHATTFHAHKCILAAGSTFFSLLLSRSQDLGEPLRSVCLFNVQPQDVKCLDSVLDFLYCGCLNINAANFLSILRLAVYLVIVDLLRLLKEYLTKLLNVENCLQLYLDLRCLSFKSADSRSPEISVLHEMKQEAWEMMETKFYSHVILRENMLQVKMFPFMSFYFQYHV